MNHTANPRLKGNAQALRRNMTEEERHLWYDFLKMLPYTVNRQKVIGEYIVDFYCAAAKLVIELDGFQHYEEEKKAADERRDAALKDLGILVLRYPNAEVNRNFAGVCEDILHHIHIRTDLKPFP